jgi:RimJ/RimL family protein N-acetyltransferase
LRWYHGAKIPEGRTKRLILRPVEIADAEQIQKLFPHWEVVRYLANRVPWPHPEDGASNTAETVLFLPSSAVMPSTGPSNSPTIQPA